MARNAGQLLAPAVVFRQAFMILLSLLLVAFSSNHQNLEQKFK